MYVKLDLVILLLSIFIGLMQKDCGFVEKKTLHYFCIGLSYSIIYQKGGLICSYAEQHYLIYSKIKQTR